MKIKLLILCLYMLAIYGCSNSNYIPEQNYKPISETTDKAYNYERYCLNNVENSFNTNSGIIDVKIPVTVNGLKIEKVEDISSEELNAIVIILNRKNNKATQTYPITGLIESKIEISKISGLDSKKLKEHKKLIVRVYNDDNYNKDSRDSFKQWVKDLKNTYPVNQPCKYYEDMIPKENGGGILNGGG